MLCRLTLLILTTGLFAAVWRSDADSRRWNAGVAAPIERAFVSTGDAGCRRAAACEVALAAVHPPAPVQPAPFAARPVLDDLLPGRYLLIGSDHRTSEVVVTAERPAASGRGPAPVAADRELYQVRRGAETWTFVRLETHVAAGPLETAELPQQGPLCSIEEQHASAIGFEESDGVEATALRDRGPACTFLSPCPDEQERRQWREALADRSGELRRL